MQIIDLMNKYVNGEVMPYHIKYMWKDYIWDDMRCSYVLQGYEDREHMQEENTNDVILFENKNWAALTHDVEIIEELKEDVK